MPNTELKMEQGDRTSEVHIPSLRTALHGLRYTYIEVLHLVCFLQCVSLHYCFFFFNSSSLGPTFYLLASYPHAYFLFKMSLILEAIVNSPLTSEYVQ